MKSSLKLIQFFITLIIFYLFFLSLNPIVKTAYAACGFVINPSGDHVNLTGNNPTPGNAILWVNGTNTGISVDAGYFGPVSIPRNFLQIGNNVVSFMAHLSHPCETPFWFSGATNAGPGTGFAPGGCAGPGNRIDTAIGCIPTTTSGFAEFFLGYLLGIGGLVAFFLIIIAGFQILTSSGNPEKLEAGKQLLTAAIVGLLFIIFSVLIMQFLNINILGNLPGFPDFSR